MAQSPDIQKQHKRHTNTTTIGIMVKTTTMNIRIDEETRQELKDFAAEIGIPATSLVNASIKQMLRTREVAFSAALEPTPYLQEIISEVEGDYATKSNIAKAETDEETLAHLRAL